MAYITSRIHGMNESKFKVLMVLVVLVLSMQFIILYIVYFWLFAKQARVVKKDKFSTTEY